MQLYWEHVSEWEGGSGDGGCSGHRQSCGPVTAAELSQGRYCCNFCLQLLVSFDLLCFSSFHLKSFFSSLFDLFF